MLLLHSRQLANDLLVYMLTRRLDHLLKAVPSCHTFSFWRFLPPHSTSKPGHLQTATITICDSNPNHRPVEKSKQAKFEIDQ